MEEILLNSSMQFGHFYNRVCTELRRREEDGAPHANAHPDRVRALWAGGATVLEAVAIIETEARHGVDHKKIYGD